MTEQFALTVGGRYNHATIELDDLTGNSRILDPHEHVQRFNPMVGGTYKVMPRPVALRRLLGGQSRADAGRTRLLRSGQPVHHRELPDGRPAAEAGRLAHLRGGPARRVEGGSQRFTWSLGYFRTLNADDILNVAASTTGRGYFLNAGDTLRQGLELAAAYQSSRFSVYGSYAFVDATFQDDLCCPHRTRPAPRIAPMHLRPTRRTNLQFRAEGRHSARHPAHRFKAGFEYWITSQWKFGSDLIWASDQYFFGDEANNNTPLSGYTRVDLHTSYDITENVQVYGLIQNLFDKRYGLYGTFFDTEEANDAAVGAGLGESSLMIRAQFRHRSPSPSTAA